MYALLNFVNQTAYPVISVEEDGQTVIADLLRGEPSPYHAFSAGSVCLIVKQNTQKPFLNMLVPLAPCSRQTLVIEDAAAHFS